MHTQLTFQTKTSAAATAFAVALAVVTAGCSREPAQVSGEQPSTPPVAKTTIEVSQLELSMADGAKKKISEFRGKVVVLDFWATYCKPCIEKLPQLQELAEKWGDKAAVVAVTLDPDVKAAAEWAKAHKITLPIASFDDAMKPILFPGQETIAIPQVRVIGPDGKLVRSLGPDDTLDALAAAVDELLAAEG